MKRPLCKSFVVAASAALFTPAQANIETIDRMTSTATPMRHCAWDSPGRNPYTGDVVSAVDRYGDIPHAVRERLKQRMGRRDYDDVVSIRRESIDGNASYAPTIRGMHFGAQTVCESVSRAKWSDQMQERGLVYCESGECILVPTVCRNVSRITRTAPAGAAPAEALAFDPSSAGAMPTGGSFATLAGLVPPPAAPRAVEDPIDPPKWVPPAITDPGPRPGPRPDPWTAPQDPPTLPPVPPPAVPEPAQWFQLVFGLSLLAALLRRRRSSARTDRPAA